MEHIIGTYLLVHHKKMCLEEEDKTWNIQTQSLFTFFLHNIAFNTQQVEVYEL